MDFFGFGSLPSKGKTAQKPLQELKKLLVGHMMSNNNNNKVVNF